MPEPEDAIQYDPFFFACDSLADAKAAILTTEEGVTTEDRWVTETDWMLPHLQFGDGLVVDYGCGIGRLSALLKQPVLGVDISPTMRAHAEVYVDRVDFAAIKPPMFEVLVASGLRAHGALAVWSLQHILDPSYDIRLLGRALISGSSLVVVNDAEYRRVPGRRRSTGEFGWVHDGVQLEPLLDDCFAKRHEEVVPRRICGGNSYLRVYVRR